MTTDLISLIEGSAGTRHVLDSAQTYVIDGECHAHAEGLELIGNGATVLGTPGSTIWLQGGDVHVGGRIMFEGFNQPAGHDPMNDDSTYRKSAPFNVAAGAQIDDVRIIGDIMSHDCRTFLRGCHGASDYKQLSAYIGSLIVSGLYCTGGPLGINLSMPVGYYNMSGNVFELMQGGGRRVGGIYIVVDGHPHDAEEYQLLGSGHVTTNRFTDIKQLKASGSRGGTNYEVHAAQLYANGLAYVGNYHEDVTGTGGLDREAFYSKAVGAVINGNVFRNCDGDQGVIACKGKERGSTAPRMKGHDVVVTSNIITWDTPSEFAGIFLRNPLEAEHANNYILNAATDIA